MTNKFKHNISLFRIILVIILLSISVYANDLKKVSLQLQWKYQFQFAGYIMAKEKGFYKDVGLDVDIKEWSHNINMVDEVINGNSQYAVSRPTSLIDISNGKEIVYLATIFQSSPLIFLTDISTGITTVKDFKNKRIMTTGDLSTDTSLLSMMYSQKVMLDDLHVQKPTFNVKDLLDNKTDLIVSYISNEPFVLKELGGTPVIFSPKDYGFDFYNDIVITSKKNLKNNSDEVRKFRNATLKGWEYAFLNIEETINILHDKYNTQNKSKDALLYEAKELKKLAYYKTNKIGKVQSSKLEKIYDVYKLLGVVKNNINFNQIIYNDNTLDIKLNQKEKEYLKNKNSIAMCIDPNWMPFEKFDENGNYIGMTADYYKLFEKTLNIKFDVIRTTSWNESIEFAKQRKCDIFSLAMETPKRKKYMNFTTPYLSIPLVITTKLNVPFINEIEDLTGKKVGITKGYAFVELLKNKYPYLNIIEVDNIDDGLDQVNKDELFAYIGTLASVGYKFQTKYSGELKIAGKISDNWELGVGVRNDDRTLLTILQKAINNISQDQKREILNKWISIKYEKGVDYTLLWGTIFVFLIIILIIFFFYIKEQYLKNELKKQKDEFETIFKNSKDGIAILDLESNFLNFNDEYLRMTGFNKEELLTKSCIELTEPEHKKDSKHIISEVIKKGYIQNFEKTCILKDNKKVIVNMSLSLMPDKQRILISTKDVTQLKKLESHAKLASMGEMIGNIAHQWRQPLSVISTGATGLQLEHEYGTLSDKVFTETCELINENAQYLSKTIDDFRNYIKGDSKLIKFNLKNDTDSFIKLVDSTIKNHQINVILDLEECIEINGYPNELIQCFINIFNNSKDALVEKEIAEDERYIFISQYKIDNNVFIEFKDNAGGIPESILPKIFEPYFTTKHQTQGTGLGLHMTYEFIINSMGGNITIENVDYQFNNKSYRGANFVIEIPLKKNKND